jgi:NAD(P)-dependent dehydrogenase (short-subunit alcohol dehydrogenase family)
MITQAAIITGGSRGLARAMTLGLAHEGYAVVAVGHTAADIAQLASEIVDTPLAERVVPILADLRQPAECDRVMAAAREYLGAVHILINNAGLTFTYIWPDLYRRLSPPQFWEATDEIVQNVIDINYVAADQMARRAAPQMVKQGWGCGRRLQRYSRHVLDGRRRSKDIPRKRGVIEGGYRCRQGVPRVRRKYLHRHGESLVGLATEVNMPAVLSLGIRG